MQQTSCFSGLKCVISVGFQGLRKVQHCKVLGLHCRLWVHWLQTTRQATNWPMIGCLVECNPAPAHIPSCMQRIVITQITRDPKKVTYEQTLSDNYSTSLNIRLHKAATTHSTLDYIGTIHTTDQEINPAYPTYTMTVCARCITGQGVKKTTILA